MFIWIAVYAIRFSSVCQILFWSCSVCWIVFLMIRVLSVASIYTSSYADEKKSVLRVTATEQILLRISKFLMVRNGMNSTYN
jgi:membrane protein implicated in regulation of membrane protease activity